MFLLLRGTIIMQSKWPQVTNYNLDFPS
jgi:hypothetical protein